MAPSNLLLLLLLSLFVALFFNTICASGDTPRPDEIHLPQIDKEAPAQDLDRIIKQKDDALAQKLQIIKHMEDAIESKDKIIEDKKIAIEEKERILEDKSGIIASLRAEISSLQKKGTSDAEEKMGRAHARAVELEKQIHALTTELAAKQSEKAAIVARAVEAEKKLNELNLKIQDLQRINDEQKSKISKTERALRVAEEEMVKAKFEATSRNKELMEVHGAWLPPWLAVHLIRCQAFIQTHWNEHGKPAMEMVIQKALEKKAEAEKWADPHVETVKTKWVPALKDQWLAVTTYAEPHVQSLTAKTVEVYGATKTAVTPHITRVHEIIDPYFQDAKKFTKPYIDQVATVAKPHVDKVRVAMKPYTKEIVHACGKFLESATTYHNQVQASVQETLKKYELTRALTTKELEWFAASALLALPIIILFKIFSALFCSKKVKKPARHGNGNHARRKAKRGHPDK